MQVVVLAGGMATRMRPMSLHLPKSLFPVAGRPFLDHQLELLVQGGATEVVLCVGHFGSQIRAHVSKVRPPVRVSISSDGEGQVGTGGALRRAYDQHLLAPEFLVTYGDSYLPVDLRPLLESHQRGERPATLIVYRNENQFDASNCIVSGDRVARYEKIADPAERPLDMVFIDYGLCALDRDEVSRWNYPLPFGLEQPLADLTGRGELGAAQVFNRFYHIGSPEALRELERLLSGEAEAHS